MDYKFLHRVLDQIVNETRIDRDKWEVYLPFLPYLSYSLSIFFYFFHTRPSLSFTKHCQDVYGLNEQETEYVWREYKMKIYNIINNG